MSGMFQLRFQKNSILTNNNLLKKRLYLIRQLRNADASISWRDKLPSLEDIKKTHINFVESSYKPFATIRYEYSIVHPQIAIENIKLGDTIRFSIPPMGDFYSDMALHCVVRAPIVTFKGNKKCPSVRWADYPGERLMKNTRFVLNSQPLDEYTSDDIVMHRQFKVPNHKLNGWKRNVGQQIPMEGYIDDDFQEHAPGYRIYGTCCNGLQTPKCSTTWNVNSATVDRPNDLEVFVPLLFWFNTDYRLAIPSVAIPYGQRFIEFTLEDQIRLFGWQQRGGSWTNSDITIEEARIEQIELYMNNLFVAPKVHAIYIKRMGHVLIRIHAKQIAFISNPQENICLDNINGAIESLFIGLKPHINISSDTDLWAWHLFSHVNEREFAIPGTKKNMPKMICYEHTPLLHTLQVDISKFGYGPYHKYPQRFYNSYIPYVHGGYNLNTPTDQGLIMINFCLNPGTHQPSGHIICSDDEHIILKFTTSFDDFNSANLIVSGSCLALLYLKDGGCKLHHIERL